MNFYYAVIQMFPDQDQGKESGIDKSGAVAQIHLVQSQARKPQKYQSKEISLGQQTSLPVRNPA